MFTLNNTIPKYVPIGSFDTPILKEILHENNKIELTISGYIDNVYYEGDFLKAIYSVLVEKDGFCEEGADCYYPDMNSPFPEDHFEGVRFEIGGLCDPRYQVNVSEEICFMYFKKACERFLELHPEKEYVVFIYDILNNWEPSKMK